MRGKTMSYLANNNNPDAHGGGYKKAGEWETLAIAQQRRQLTG
jgi:hypothetical protein